MATGSPTAAHFSEGVEFVDENDGWRFLQRLLPLRYPAAQMTFPDMLTVAGFMPEKLAAMLDPEKVDALLREIDRAAADIERNVQAKMVLFDLSLQAFKILRKQP